MGVGRVRLRRTFRELRADGVRRRSGPLTVTTLVTDGDIAPRAAYAIGKAVGPAVVRNRVRRRLRSAVGEVAPPGTYLITAAPAAASLSYAELRHHLEQALPAAPTTAVTPSPGPEHR
jgi:ribonuclease P protein component